MQHDKKPIFQFVNDYFKRRFSSNTPGVWSLFEYNEIDNKINIHPTLITEWFLRLAELSVESSRLQYTDCWPLQQWGGGRFEQREQQNQRIREAERSLVSRLIWRSFRASFLVICAEVRLPTGLRQSSETRPSHTSLSRLCPRNDPRWYFPRKTYHARSNSYTYLHARAAPPRGETTIKCNNFRGQFIAANGKSGIGPDSFLKLLRGRSGAYFLLGPACTAVIHRCTLRKGLWKRGAKRTAG